MVTDGKRESNDQFIFERLNNGGDEHVQNKECSHGIVIYVLELGYLR